MAPAFHHPVQADIDPSSRAMRDLSGRKNLHIKIIVGIAAAGRLEQHAGGSSDLGLGERPARFPAQPDERLRPLLFDRRRNLIRQGGGGGGAGINITPIAFIAVSNGDVRVLPLVSSPDSNSQIVNLVPELVNKVSDLFKKKKEKTEVTTVEADKDSATVTVTQTES